MMPMKVKKGIASNVSLEITPHNRCGMVKSKGQSSVIVPSDIGASQTPMAKNTKPLAASENATG